MQHEVDYVKPTAYYNANQSKALRLTTSLHNAISDQALPMQNLVHDEILNILNTKVAPHNDLGTDEELTVLQALILSLAQKGMQGSMAASKLLLEWYSHGITLPSNITPASTSTTNIQINNIDPVTRKMLQSIGVEL